MHQHERKEGRESKRGEPRAEETAGERRSLPGALEPDERDKNLED